MIPSRTYYLRKRFRHENEYKPKKAPFRKQILNLETGEFLGRNCISWFVVISFYTAFLLGLALFSTICYLAFKATVDDNVPTYLMTQPGISFSPCANRSALTTLTIMYAENIDDEVNEYVGQIDDFLNKYGKDRERFGNCTSDNDYGYKTRSPCIFLKINKCLGFKADTYNEASELPNDAPNELKSYIDALPAAKRKDRIWISCWVKKKLEIVYYPTRSVGAEHVHTASKTVYDRNDQEGNKITDDRKFFDTADLERIVAVQLRDMPVKEKILVKCTFWAKNIEIDPHQLVGQGMVKVEIRIDDEHPKRKKPDGDGDA